MCSPAEPRACRPEGGQHLRPHTPQHPPGQRGRGQTRVHSIPTTARPRAWGCPLSTPTGSHRLTGDPRERRTGVSRRSHRQAPELRGATDGGHSYTRLTGQAFRTRCPFPVPQLSPRPEGVRLTPCRVPWVQAGHAPRRRLFHAFWRPRGSLDSRVCTAPRGSHERGVWPPRYVLADGKGSLHDFGRPACGLQLTHVHASVSGPRHGRACVWSDGRSRLESQAVRGAPTPVADL